MKENNGCIVFIYSALTCDPMPEGFNVDLWGSEGKPGGNVAFYFLSLFCHNVPYGHCIRLFTNTYDLYAFVVFLDVQYKVCVYTFMLHICRNNEMKVLFFLPQDWQRQKICFFLNITMWTLWVFNLCISITQLSLLSSLCALTSCVFELQTGPEFDTEIVSHSSTLCQCVYIKKITAIQSIKWYLAFNADWTVLLNLLCSNCKCSFWTAAEENLRFEILFYSHWVLEGVNA